MSRGELREGYIAKWREYPEDEVKIRVARPSVLAPSKELLKEVMDYKKSWQSAGLGLSELEARKNALVNVNYEERFRKEILASPYALLKIGVIINKLKAGKNVRLICYEKNPPCHRFILMDMIREME